MANGINAALCSLLVDFAVAIRRYHSRFVLLFQLQQLATAAAATEKLCTEDCARKPTGPLNKFRYLAPLQ